MCQIRLGEINYVFYTFLNMEKVSDSIINTFCEVSNVFTADSINFEIL